MADKLALYNAALLLLGAKRLASLSVQGEARQALDDAWDQEVAYCLERKFWNFSYRSIQLDASASIVPQFGYTYAFPIPSDWIRTRKLSSVETLDPPLLQVAEEAGYWYANITPIYVQFNSRDTAYGMDLAQWPASFCDYVIRRMARQTCLRITEKAALLEGPYGLIKQEERAYKIAAANCAMNEAVGFAPMTGWVRARRGGFGTGDNPTGSTLVP